MNRIGVFLVIPSERCDAASLSQGQLDQALDWYRSIHEENTQRLNAVDVEDKGRAVEELRREFGAGYQEQIQVVKSILSDNLPKQTIRILNNARDPSTGKRIINDPNFLKMILNSAGQGSGRSSGRGSEAARQASRNAQAKSGSWSPRTRSSSYIGEDRATMTDNQDNPPSQPATKPRSRHQSQEEA